MGAQTLKERVYSQVQRRFPKLEKITTPTTVGAVVIRPFPQKILQQGWSRYLPYICSMQDKPKLTLFGKHVPRAELDSFVKSVVSSVSDPELAAWEKDEILGKDEYRGTFDPWMYLTRLCLYDPQYYGTARIPRMAFPDVPEFQPISMDSVEINEKHANTGFPWLKPLFPRDAPSDTLYRKVLVAAALWSARVLAVEHPSADFLRSLTPPSAGFWRAQSEGRPVEGESKEIVIPEMQVAQPLQRALEATDWYAYGDRKARFLQMSRLVNQRVPGDGLADGDDFCGVLNDGSLFSGDASAFDTSVREIDTIEWENAVKHAYTSDSSQILRVYLATQKAADAVDIAANVGMVQVPYRHGVKSGTGSTHIKDSYIEMGRWTSAKPWSTKEQVCTQMGRVGGIIKPESQRVGTHWVFLAKLACNGSTLFGSVVRGANGLMYYEDLPSAYAGPVDDDSRVVSIVANSWAPKGAHPCWNMLVDWVRKYWDIRADKHTVLAKAADKMSKQRRFQRSKETGEWERAALEATWAALS